MDCREREAARDSTGAVSARPTKPCRFGHAGFLMPRVACAVVCAVALLSAPLSLAHEDLSEPRIESSSLKIRENSFPRRKVALQGAVRDGLVLKVSLGVDHQLERGGIGRPTPSVGVQFERTFR